MKLDELLTAIIVKEDGMRWDLVGEFIVLVVAFTAIKLIIRRK